MTKHISRAFVACLFAAYGLGQAAPLAAKEGLSAGTDGIKFESGDVEVTLGGRLHLDAVTFDDGAGNESEADVRRARLELSGRIGDVLRFRVDREFAGADGWRNLWASVRPIDAIEIKGGNFIVPFSMEDMQSSNDTVFVERSLASTLAPAFGLGGAVKAAGNNWTVSAGYFGDALDDAEGRAKERGDGFAGRATFAPMRGDDGFLHLGAAYEHRSFDTLDLVRFSSGPGSDLAPNLIQTGTIASPSKLNNVGAELAFAHRSLQFQGQYIATRLSRDLGPRLKFDGWYGQVSWMLTGENYQYSRSSGLPSGPKLRKKRGGVELAARYSELDLDNSALDAGKASSISVGANWYVFSNVRLMANYVHSTYSDSLVRPDHKVDLGVARLQIAF